MIDNSKIKVLEEHNMKVDKQIQQINQKLQEMIDNQARKNKQLKLKINSIIMTLKTFAENKEIEKEKRLGQELVNFSLI